MAKFQPLAEHKNKHQLVQGSLEAPYIAQQKPLDKIQAAEYNINVKRLCRKRCPQLKLKNNRSILGYGAVIFYCSLFYCYYVTCGYNEKQDNHCQIFHGNPSFLS